MWILVIIAATSIGGFLDPHPFVTVLTFATEQQCREFSAKPEWKSWSSDVRTACIRSTNFDRWMREMKL